MATQCEEQGGINELLAARVHGGSTRRIFDCADADYGVAQCSGYGSCYDVSVRVCVWIEHIISSFSSNS
jgi:hypothetical protein